MTLTKWLAQAGLARLEPTFRDNSIDLDVVRSLTDGDLREMGLALGDRKRVLTAIALLDATSPTAPSVEPPSIHGVAGRRQLTVVFVDLVGSTALSQAMDPEDMRDVLRGYHEAVAAAVREGGGFVAKFMGDGMLAYFGYPQATEDAAERAIRASLKAVAAVKGLPNVSGSELSARVGIATGPVVVGDIIGDDVAREVNVVGETPNLAARLQTLARADGIVIAEATRRIVGELFGLVPLGAQVVKGIAEPIVAFEVSGAREGLSRFEATRASQRSRFVGRAQEVGLLLDRWKLAKAGEGQIVLLSGEAGIGKSRITETMLREIQSEPHHLIRYQCTPQHTNSPLYPAVAQLSHLAGLQPEDDDVAKTARIAKVLTGATEDQVALVAHLLGASLPAGSPIAHLTAALRLQLILDAFMGQIEALCDQHPVLMVIEDSHWIDPTTEELISRVVEKAPALRLLIAVTHRPEYHPPWASAPATTGIALNRLSRAYAGALLEGLAGGKDVPSEAVEYIAARADGIPLYVEELFRALCDSGTLSETDTAFSIARPLDGIGVPSTLQDSLMARLDRLAPARAIAQIGAVIGREFEHSLLSAVAEMGADALDEGLGQLLGAGLLYRRGKAPNTVYTFKHALVQDAAYGSLLKQRRQRVHGQIANALAGQAKEARPELVAHHFEAAGHWELAAISFEKAGDVAAQASANREAVRFWRGALGLCANEMVKGDLRRMKINLNQKIAVALVQIEGYGSPGAFEAFSAALQLALDLDDPELYVGSSTAIASSLNYRQDYDGAERCLASVSAEVLGKVSAAAQARYWYRWGVTHVHRGRIAEGRRDLEKTIAILEAATEPHAQAFASADVGVTAHGYLSRATMAFGLPDKATGIAYKGLALARESGHAFTFGWALFAVARNHVWRGEYASALPLIAKSIQVAERHGFGSRLGQALTGRGMALVGLGNTEDGVRDIDLGLDYWRKGTGEFALAQMLTDVGEMLARKGLLQLARPYVAEAERYYARGGPERHGYPEFLRLEALLAAANGDRSLARVKLGVSIAAADEHAANLCRLRSSRDLAQLLVEDGDRAAARGVLEPVYGWFTEGFGTPDLLEAKALLEALE